MDSGNVILFNHAFPISANKKPPRREVFIWYTDYFFAFLAFAFFTLTFSFSCLETRNAGVLDAGILISAWVEGLWPTRALR